MFKFLFFYILFFTSILLKAQFNYGHQMDFGKNRVQYKPFNWTYFDYDRYRVYSYQGGNELAKYVSVSFNNQLKIIEKRLNMYLEKKVSILVFNSQSDFKQSNLGLSSQEQFNLGGVTKIIGDKISVFFNGSHAELDQQISAVLSELIINKIMAGGTASEKIKSSTLLSLPEWYTSGLVKYLSEGWTSSNDNLMYDDIKMEKFNYLNRLTGKDAAQVGHAIWYYIVSSYGVAVIPNLLEMTRIQRSPDNAFLFILGLSLDDLIYDFTDSYSRRFYLFKDSLRQSPVNKIINNNFLKRYKTNRHYYQFRLSPDGKQAIFAVNELNQLKVYLKAIDSKKKSRLFKFDQKLEQEKDYNYPLLAWHPSGKFISIIYSSKDIIRLQIHNLETKEVVERILPGFEKINSCSYNSDGKKIVLSAVKKGKGQSDVFVFNINSSGIEQLTNDIWDDNNPVFVNNSKQIVFESNRLSDTIKSSDEANYFVKINRNSDLFMASYPIINNVLVRITNTPEINEIKPLKYKNQFVTYLSDKNGIYNRYLAKFDSAITFIDTTEHYSYFFTSRVVSNSDHNIIEHHINESSSQIAEVIFNEGKDMLLISPLEELDLKIINEPKITWHKSNINASIDDPNNIKEIQTNEELIPQKKDSNQGIDFNNYKFDDPSKEKVEEKNKKNIFTKDELKNNYQFKFPILQNYYTSFNTDFIVSQLDNSFLGNNYQKFSNSDSPIYLNPGLNTLFKVSISDLMENQRIVAGFRINPSIDNEFMLSWEQRRWLVDHKVIFDRQTTSNVPVNSIYSKIITHSINYSIKYPFSPSSSARISFLYRNDRTIALSYNDKALNLKPSNENLVGLRLEYVFDNTRNVMLNILNGCRLKIWTEYWQFTDKSQSNLITSGFDARHYLKIHRQITWCNRFAGGNSLGTDRLIFYLGGVDNWVNPNFNNAVNVIKPEQYGFQTLATNMRGFNQNIRNGNNFLILNSEIRIPVVQYLFNNPVRSEFFNNFQVIGFTDLGMAWYGPNPLSNDNTQNPTSYIDNDPNNGKGGTGIIIKIIDQKNPLVGGIGFGFRSKILGFFVRMDCGWGIDNLILQKRIIGLSLSTDF